MNKEINKKYSKQCWKWVSSSLQPCHHQGASCEAAIIVHYDFTGVNIFYLLLCVCDTTERRAVRGSLCRSVYRMLVFKLYKGVWGKFTITEHAALPYHDLSWGGEVAPN